MTDRIIVKRCLPWSSGYGLFVERDGQVEAVPAVGYGLRKEALAAAARWGMEVVDLTRSRQQRWQQRHPERRAAHEAVRRALLRGDLVRQPCEDCGTTHNVDAHHERYDRPLEVNWLCRRHHIARHRPKLVKVKGPKG